MNGHKIKLEKGEVIISKWMREGENEAKGVKISIFDDTTMATAFVSLAECEKILVALYKEKEKVREDLRELKKEAKKE